MGPPKKGPNSLNGALFHFFYFHMGLNCPKEVLTQFSFFFENSPLRDHCATSPNWATFPMCCNILVKLNVFALAVVSPHHEMRSNGLQSQHSPHISQHQQLTNPKLSRSLKEFVLQYLGKIEWLALTCMLTCPLNAIRSKCSNWPIQRCSGSLVRAHLITTYAIRSNGHQSKNEEESVSHGWRSPWPLSVSPGLLKGSPWTNQGVTWMPKYVIC